MSPQIAVSCRGISKRFVSEGSEVWALRDIQLEVQAGEIMMLVGPSGCGKTTLISVIAGILGYDEGTCEVLATNYKTVKPSAMLDFRARNIGFIFQSFNLLPALSVAENVSIPLIINGTDRHQALTQARVMLAEVGLAERADSRPNQLSGGQQQRVAIARALVHSPKVLVCDEPTSALDHTTGMRIMELIQKLNRERGTSIVVVTHDSRIFPYAHRIAHMDDGHITELRNNR